MPKRKSSSQADASVSPDPIIDRPLALGIGRWLARGMGRWLARGMGCWLALAVVLAACGDSTAPAPTRNLRGSGDVSFICAAFDDQRNLFGRPLDSCPDFEGDPDAVDNASRQLYALVTQVETGEVALVQMPFCQDGGVCPANVLDLETTQPGATFMAVGAEPVSVASTPGGVASFVAVAEPGKEGIFALPTSCLGPRFNEEDDAASFRDIRTWPACRLPAAPGDMEVVLAPGDGRCADPLLDDDDDDLRTGECSADLEDELLSEGRHKLLVALPSLGSLAVIDAQTLLNREQGSFDACPIDRIVSLSYDADAVASVPLDVDGVPAEMSLDRGYACSTLEFPHALETADDLQPTPADFAVQDELLYVADESAPVIHRLDIGDACDISEDEPLLPSSYLDPDLSVTTRKVAVSPLTTRGERFLYAIDASPSVLAGSVMVFDVSPDSERLRPIVRDRSSLITNEPPDRIQFDQEISDITFGFQDLPPLDDMGVAQGGLSCDPDPDLTLDDPRVLLRPNSDGTGADPTKLRGVFAFAALHSGVVAVIDVEDLDAPCRRPTSVNTSSEPDRFGCFDDEFDADELVSGGSSTTTNELSCNISEAHRARSSDLFRFDDSGPRLRSFPQLRDEDGASISVDQSPQGRSQPRILGVNSTSESEDAEVWVGGTYFAVTDAANPLLIDPAQSERNSVVLPFQEPRAYTSSVMLNTLTYEGAVQLSTDAPFLPTDGEELREVYGLADADGVFAGRRYGVLEGGVNGRYCASGIEDSVLMRDRGARQFGDQLTDEQLDEFAIQYGDYVNVVGDLLDSDNTYWDGAGDTCGDDLTEATDGLSGREVCDLFFGTSTLPDPHREYRVVRAANNQLIVEPRRFRGTVEREAALDLLQCCFPELVEFEVRASNQWIRRVNTAFEHDIQADPESLLCGRSCNPQVAGRSGRVFEIACDGDCEADDSSGAAGAVVGPSDYATLLEDEDESFDPTINPAALVCILDEHPTGGIDPEGPNAACVHDSPTARFALYRGLAPSRRDMEFSWRSLGGFSVLAVDLLDLVGIGSTSNPRRIEFLPQVGRLVVADGGLAGMEVIGLRSATGRAVFAGSTSSAR